MVFDFSRRLRRFTQKLFARRQRRYTQSFSAIVREFCGNNYSNSFDRIGNSFASSPE